MQPPHLSAAFSTPAFSSRLPPSSSSLSVSSTPTSPHTITSIPHTSPALQFAQRRARILQEQLTSLEALINQSVLEASTAQDDVAEDEDERRRRRKVVCELLMPLVIKTDLYKRWEVLARPATAAHTADERSAAEGEDDSKRQEEQLLREVLAERQPMAEWSDEQKEAMIRYTLQLQARASGGGVGSGGSASSAVRLSELMEACMSMYQSLVTTQQQLEELQAQQAAAGVAQSTSTSSSSSSYSSSSSSSSSLPASTPTIATLSSSTATSSSSSSPATRDLAFYVQQHAADQREVAHLRHQLHQLQSTSPASTSPSSSASPQSLLGSVSSVVCALQLLYVGVWLWRQSSERRGALSQKAVVKSWWQVVEEWLSGMVGWFTG